MLKTEFDTIVAISLLFFSDFSTYLCATLSERQLPKRLRLSEEIP
jgi:hypothetical protein